MRFVIIFFIFLISCNKKAFFNCRQLKGSFILHNNVQVTTKIFFVNSNLEYKDQLVKIKLICKKLPRKDTINYLFLKETCNTKDYYEFNNSGDLFDDIDIEHSKLLKCSFVKRKKQIKIFMENLNYKDENCSWLW